MSEEIGIKVDLSLDTEKAKRDLNNFKENVTREPIKIEVDTSSIRDETDSIRRLLANSFRIDREAVGGLDNVENRLREITRVMQHQSRGTSGNAFGLDKAYSQLDKIEEKLTNMKNSKGFLDEGLVQRTNALLAETRRSLDSNGIESDFTQVRSSIEEMSRSLRDLNMGNTLSRQEAQFNNSLDSMRIRIDRFADTFRDLEGSDDTVDRLRTSLNNINTSNIERASVDLGRLRNELNEATRDSRRIQENTRTFFGNFGQEFTQNLFSFTAGELLADGIRNVAQSLKTLVIEYDTAMANLKKVANPGDIMNISQLDVIEQKAVSVAKNMGAKSSEVIQAIADTVQMSGKGMQESILVAEKTMQLANVAELSQETASKGVVTMMSAFKLDALKGVQVEVDGVKQSTDQLTDSMDKLNYIGNTQPISSGGLLDAITSGANVLASFNVDINDTLSMITAANTTLQDPTRVGNGLKSIAMNLNGIKASADDGTLSLNKTAKTLGEVAGITVFSNEKKGELKGMSQIMTELADKWDGFNDKERAGLAEAIAGKNQASVFQSLMQNFDKFKQVRSELNDGWHFGSALAENEQYVSSLQGRLNSLKETWVGIFNTLYNEESVKGIVSGLVTLSEGIAGLISNLDEVGFAVPALTIGLTSLFGVFKGADKVFNPLSAIASVGNSSFSILKGAMFGAQDAYRSFSNELGSSSNRIRGTFNGLRMATTGFGDGMRRAGVATNVMRGLTGLLNGALIGLAVVGISTAIKKFDEYIRRHEIAAEKSRKNIEATKEDIKSLQGQKEGISSIAEEYDKLAKKTNKSADEMARFSDLKKEIAEKIPDLVLGYDENNDPILAMSGNVTDLISELDRAVESKQRLLESQEKDLGIHATENIKKTVKELKNSLASMSNSLTGGSISVNNALANKNFFGAEISIKDRTQKVIKALENEEKEYTERYNKHLKNLEKYNSDELEIQKENLNQLFKKDNYKGLEDNLKGSVNSFASFFDWGNQDLSKQKQMVQGIEKLAKSVSEGKINLEDFNTRWQKINDTFQNTGDIDSYNKSINQLAKELEDATGVDAGKWIEGLSHQFEGLNYTDAKLNKFLQSYNSSLDQLKNGDSIAIELKKQFDELSNFSNLIDSEIEATGKIGIEPLIEVKESESFKYLPKQIQTLIDSIISDDNVTEAEEDVLLNLKTIIQNEGALDDEVSEQLNRIFTGNATEKDLEIGVKIGDYKIPPDLVKILNDEYKNKNVGIDFKVNTEEIEKIQDAENKLNKLREDGKVTTETQFIVNGQDKADLYLKIIKKIQAEPELTNKFILENEDALSKFKTIEEVKAWLQKNPDIVNKYEIKGIEKIDDAKKKKDALEKDGESDTTVKATEKGVTETKDKVKELDETVKSADGKEVNVKANNENVIDSIKDIETLINLSAKVEDGKYKLDIEANTEGAVTNINNLKDAVNELSNQFRNSPITTIKFNVETAQGAKNITGLKNRVNEYKDLSTSVPTTKFNTDTATASKNVTGLKNNVSSYIKSYGGKSFSTKFNCQTALASQNVTGLRRNVSSYIDSYAGKTFTTTFKVVTNKVTNTVQTNSGGNSGGNEGGTFNLTRSVSAPTNLASASASTAPLHTRTRRSISEPVFAAAPNPTSYVPSPMMMSMARMDNVPTFASPMLASRSLSTYSNSRSITPYSSPRAIAPYNLASRAIPKRTQSTPIAIAGKDIQNALKYDVELLKELENRINKVNNQLSLLDTKMENAVGTEKIGYLQQQNALYQEQLDLQKDLQDKLQRQKNNYESYLKSKGFQFNSEGNLRNYEEKLMAMEKEAERLQNIANKDKSTDGQKKASENYNKSLSETKKFLESYIQVAMTDLPKVEDEFEKIKNIIEDNNQAIKDLNNEIKDLKVEAMFTSMEKQVKQYGNELSKIDALMENAFGDTDRLDLMSQKLEIMKNQIQQYQKMMNYSQNEMNNVKKELEGFGFTFRDNGDIINYTSLISQLKESNREYERADKLVSKYLDLLTNKLPDYEKSIIDVNNAIFEMQWAMDEVVRKQKMFADTAKLKELSMEYDKLSDKLSLIDEKMKHAYGKDKIALIELQIETLEQQRKAQEDYIASYNNMLNAYQGDLGKFGIQFDKDGGITNLQTVMNDMKDSQGLDNLLKLVDEYIEIQRDKLPDAVKEWESLNNAIKDAYKEQLNVTKEIEDKITSIYKKQLEERKKLIKKELDKKLEALEKEKKAYNDARKEADYKRDYDDQTDVIADLQKKLDIAIKDDSLSGQKKVQELQKKLEEEQRKLQDLVQNKIDGQINDMFDKESERLEEDADNEIKDLEDKWSDSKIAEMVAQALGSGVFTDIEGNVVSLEKALLDFCDETGESFGVLGSVIKNELISNLQLATDTVKNLDTILSNLKLNDISGYSLDSLISPMSNITESRSSIRDVNFNESFIKVEGNIDNNVMKDLEKLSREIEQNVTKAIVKAIK